MRGRFGLEEGRNAVVGPVAGTRRRRRSVQISHPSINANGTSASSARPAIRSGDGMVVTLAALSRALRAFRFRPDVDCAASHLGAVFGPQMRRHREEYRRPAPLRLRSLALGLVRLRVRFRRLPRGRSAAATARCCATAAFTVGLRAFFAWWA